MMRPAVVLPLLVALAGCTPRTEPPRALPPPPPPAAADASSPTADATAPPPAEATALRDVVSFALAPYQGTCAVRRDGSVWCRGDREHLWAPAGPVAPDRTAPEGAAPMPGISGATAVCMLSDAACVLRGDRSVVCRALVSDHNEETGDSTERVTETAPPALRNITALDDTELGCVALDGDGQAFQLQQTTEVTARRLTEPIRRCTLGADETRCVGPNAAGLLANETTAAFTAAAPARLFGLRGLRSVAWSGNHACAALADGTVRCWGRNLDGQLGLADLRSRALPAAVPGLDGVVSLAAIDGATCAVRTDGTVWCWGSNQGGVFGVEGRPVHPEPRQVAGLEGVASLTLRDDFACALHRDGRLSCWGNATPRRAGTPSWQPRPVLRAPEPAPAAPPAAPAAG